MTNYNEFQNDLRYMVETMIQQSNEPRPTQLTMMVSPQMKKTIEEKGWVNKQGYCGYYAGIPVKLDTYKPFKKKHWWQWKVKS